jgi:hypothetical protein
VGSGEEVTESIRNRNRHVRKRRSKENGSGKLCMEEPKVETVEG